MALVEIEDAMRQCKADPDQQPEVEDALAGAIANAQNFLNRDLYETPEAIAAARTAAWTAYEAAITAYDEAIEAAASVSDPFLHGAATAAAEQQRRQALCTFERAAYGIVITDDIRIAILQTTGSYFRNREEVVTGTGAAQLPQSAMDILYRRRRHEEL